MSLVAAIRPDEWNFPLLVHVFGAMVLVGGMLAAVTALLAGWRREAGPYTRFAFWTLLVVAFPSWWIMRLGAGWIYSKEDFGDEDPAWVGIGFIAAEPGLLVLLLAIILTGIGARRLRTAELSSSSLLTRVAGVLAALSLLAYTVAVWAMTAKPD